MESKSRDPVVRWCWSLFALTLAIITHNAARYLVVFGRTPEAAPLRLWRWNWDSILFATLLIATVGLVVCWIGLLSHVRGRAPTDEWRRSLGFMALTQSMALTRAYDGVPAVQAIFLLANLPIMAALLWFMYKQAMASSRKEVAEYQARRAEDSTARPPTAR